MRQDTNNKNEMKWRKENEITRGSDDLTEEETYKQTRKIPNSQTED